MSEHEFTLTSNKNVCECQEDVGVFVLVSIDHPITEKRGEREQRVKLSEIVKQKERGREKLLHPCVCSSRFSFTSSQAAS